MKSEFTDLLLLISNHMNPRPLKCSPSGDPSLLTFAFVFLILGTTVTQEAFAASPKPS